MMQVFGEGWEERDRETERQRDRERQREREIGVSCSQSCFCFFGPALSYCCTFVTGETQHCTASFSGIRHDTLAQYYVDRATVALLLKSAKAEKIPAQLRVPWWRPGG